ncbi:MAG: hypothetical protein M1840_000525 [Geoglossum simile]|nr:MAG: hypothetical protein M1840_000525 [Geoglossum simile]
MAANTLLPIAILNILSSLAPGPSYYETDLPHTTCGSYSISTARLATALLSYAPNPHHLAGPLWLDLVDPANSTDGERLSAAFCCHEIDKSGSPITMTLLIPWTWERVASDIIRPSACLKNVVMRWAEQWLAVLLIPVLARGKTPTPATTNSATRAQNELRQLNSRITPFFLLYQRDGYTSPISGLIDRDAPDDGLTFMDPGIGYALLKVAHILPFSLNNRSDTLCLLEIFSGGQIHASNLAGNNINKPYNAILLDATSHDAFDAVDFSIRVDTSQTPTRYHLVKFTDRLPAQISQKASSHTQQITNASIAKSLVYFGNGDQGLQVPLPDPEICNVHFALACVLHASGAAEALQLVLRDESERELRASRPSLSTIPKTGCDPGFFYLWRRLLGAGGTLSVDEKERQLSTQQSESRVF